MKIINCLKEQKNVLTDPVVCSFFKAGYNPSIKGKYEGYDAEFGVEIGGGGDYVYDYSTYCKIKLNNPPQLPLFLKYKLNITDSFGDLLFLKNGWLYIYYGYEIGMSKKKLLSNLSHDFGEVLRKQFARLADKAKLLERGNLDLREYLIRQKKQNWFMVNTHLIIIAGVCIVCWFYLIFPQLVEKIYYYRYARGSFWEAFFTHWN